MAKKRSKAVVDELPIGNASIRMSEMDSNTPPNSTQESHGKEPNDDKEKDKKKARGASKLKLVAGQQVPIELERNEFGQPVGDESVDLSTFLGCLTREFVSYAVEIWDDVYEDVKNKLWSCVKMKYKFEEWEKTSVLQKLNKLWRDGKSKLQISIREANIGPLGSRRIGLLKPETISKDDWKILVERTLSPEFQEKSKKFSEMRKKQKYHHTTSRKGYARLGYDMKKKAPPGTTISRAKVWVKGQEKKSDGKPSTQDAAEKMKEIADCPPELQDSTNIRDDALSRVLGQEARGRVRGMGFGVKPSQVGPQIQNNVTVKQLLGTVEKLQQDMAMLYTLVQQKEPNQPEQATSGGVMSGIGNEVTSGHTNGARKKDGRADKSSEFVATPQSNQRFDTPEKIPENAKCKLLHYNGDGEVVAEGRIASTDPKATVHHVTLGRTCWKVWVDRVIVKNVDLIRPNEEMLTLDDALGSTVAWWPKFIILVD